MHQPEQNPDSQDQQTEQIFTATLADPPGHHQASNRWATRLLILSVVALVLGPVLWQWIPREIARWHTAVAAEKHAAGDEDGALAQLDKALAWDPAAEIYQRRGDWHLQAGRYEAALGDFTQAIELEPGRRESYIQRSLALQHLGRRTEAIEDWICLEQLAEGSAGAHQAVAWNGLAYARALANSDLDRALEEVDRALGMFGPNAAMLDTRGYIHYLRGDLEAALQDLDQAVQMMELELARLSSYRAYSDRKQYELDLRNQEQSVAVLRYHRALVHEKSGSAKLAEQDLHRVRQLGYEPGDDLF